MALQSMSTLLVSSVQFLLFKQVFLIHLEEVILCQPYRSLNVAIMI